jgi:hypothetical protein
VILTTERRRSGKVVRVVRIGGEIISRYLRVSRRGHCGRGRNLARIASAVVSSANDLRVLFGRAPREFSAAERFCTILRVFSIFRFSLVRARSFSICGLDYLQ